LIPAHHNFPFGRLHLAKDRISNSRLFLVNRCLNSFQKLRVYFLPNLRLDAGFRADEAAYGPSKMLEQVANARSRPDQCSTFQVRS
jgi:hypothetical protein